MAPTPEELEAARQKGREDATAMAEQHAPEDPLLRVAWVAGAGDATQIRDAVGLAREAGASWSEIALATGDGDRRVAETKYGRGYERQKEYRERKRRQRRGEE